MFTYIIYIVSSKGPWYFYQILKVHTYVYILLLKSIIKRILLLTGNDYDHIQEMFSPNHSSNPSFSHKTTSHKSSDVILSSSL